MSAFSIILTLACSGIAILVWMGAETWDDMIGVSVGVIFIVLALLQTGFTIYWYTLEKNRSAKFRTNR